jgi:hypothetical protein
VELTQVNQVKSNGDLDSEITKGGTRGSKPCSDHRGLDDNQGETSDGVESRQGVYLCPDAQDDATYDRTDKTQYLFLMDEPIVVNAVRRHVVIGADPGLRLSVVEEVTKARREAALQTKLDMV